MRILRALRCWFVGHDWTWYRSGAFTGYDSFFVCRQCRELRNSAAWPVGKWPQ